MIHKVYNMNVNVCFMNRLVMKGGNTMSHWCTTCNGKGYITCRRCGGDGTIQKRICYHCNGDKVEVCPACNGRKYHED